MYKLPKLMYNYKSLEPYVDEKTMETHHTKHHASYVNNTNTIMSQVNDGNRIVTVLKDIMSRSEIYDPTIFKGLLLAAGGHLNHTLYFRGMSPHRSGAVKKRICQTLNDKITVGFESSDKLIDLFAEKALSVVGSGWVWLCYARSNVTLSICSETGTIGAACVKTGKIECKAGELVILTTKNQENPIMFSSELMPLIGMDVWEHAYYLKHQEKRKDYVFDFFKVLNWEFVSLLYEKQVVEGKGFEVDYDGEVVFEE